MTIKKFISLLCSFLLFVELALSARQGQTNWLELKKLAPNIFLDCSSCDSDYIRTEITFVNYVRDPKEADIHILITTQETGSGGQEYTITFIGQNRFNQQGHTLKYYSNKTNTLDEIRQGLVKTLKIGLASYVAQTPLSDFVSVDFKEKKEAADIKDKWHHWVFNLRANGYMYKEESQSWTYLNGSFSASKVTPKIKMNYNLSASFNRTTYDYEGVHSAYDQHSYGLSGTIVKSLGEHWSAGGYASFSSSIYGNTKAAFSLAPAIEYGLFPYSQSTRKQLCFLYRIGVKDVKYIEETIYGRLAQVLFYESLAVNVEITQPWGSVYGGVEGLHYLPDFSKNHIHLNLGTKLRIFKGFSLNLSGGYYKIHDQLSLVKGELTEQEVLLQLKQIATTYSYNFSVGITITFGSIYSNVVNPRFGGAFSGGM